MDLHHIILFATEAVQTAEETGGVLGTLGVRWDLFLAQLVNFGLVLFIFWKWIVKPLAKTLSDRQEKIEKGLQHASYMETERKNFEQWKNEEMKKVRGEAEAVLKQTNDVAAKIKQEAVVDTNNQVSMMIAQAKASIEQEKVNVMKEAKEEIANLVVTVAEKILHEKLDTKKDHELITEKLRNI